MILASQTTHHERPRIPAAPDQEDGTMFVEAATRVGLAYAAAITIFAVLMHVLA